MTPTEEYFILVKEGRPLINGHVFLGRLFNFEGSRTLEIMDSPTYMTNN